MADTGATLNGKVITVNDMPFCCAGNLISYKAILLKYLHPILIPEGPNICTVTYRVPGSAEVLVLSPGQSAELCSGLAFTVTPKDYGSG